MRNKLLDRKNIEEELNYEVGAVERNFKNIETFKEYIEKGLYEDESDEGHKLGLIKLNYSRIIGRKINTISYKYTLGFNMEDLHKEYLVLIDQIDKIDGAYGYYYSNVVAIIILFEEEGMDKLQKLVDVMDKYGAYDIVADYLINGCGLKRRDYSKGFSDKDIKFSKELIELAQKDRDKASKKLVYHLKKEWTFPVENYKRTKGRWLWEYAAIVKMFGLDDSEIKDHPHYPYDLVHYKSEMKFFPEKMLDFPKEYYKEGIPDYPRLEKLIPAQFHEITNNLFIDFRDMSDEEFYEEYASEWIEYDEYIKQKDKLFGQFLIATLTDEYIFTFDKLDDLEEIEEYKSFWGKRKVRPVCFDLGDFSSDCFYIAYVPKSMKLKSIFGIKIIDVKDIEELDQYSAYIGQFDDE